MTDDAKKSRVLTLVFTDLVSSTALKTERGDDRADALITRHCEHVARLVEESSGRVIDWAGDGCFSTFETSSAAVMFALRLQQVHAEDVELPGVRIGIHMGEVTEKIGPDGSTQIKGLAVDLAARIQGLARSGQVLMSAAVYDSARQRIGVDALGEPILWQAHGTYSLKGFDKPLEIGEAGLEGSAPLEAPKAGDKAKLVRRAGKSGTAFPARPWAPGAPRPTILPSAIVVVVLVVATIAVILLMKQRLATQEGGETALDIGPITSLAVLPLANLSNDPDQDYFADSMTDAIIGELAKIEGLKVISRTSTVQYKSTTKSIPEIAAELRVEGIIEGSVLREGDEVRITAQLIHGPSDTHLWTESYTNTMTSVLKLQSKVALAIADAVNVEVTGEVRGRIASAQEVNPEAYDAYVIGQHYLNDISEEGLNTAIRYFNDVTELDPNFAHGWGGLVCAYWEIVAHGFDRPRLIYPKARAAGFRALQINDDMSTDQSHLGMVSMAYDLEWEVAEERFLHAVELSPSDPIALGDYALFLKFVGRDGEGLMHATMTLDIDPTPRVFSAQLSLEAMFLESDPERVRVKMERFLAQEPDYLPTLGVLTLAYSYLGMDDAGMAAAEQWVERSGGNPASLMNLALVLADNDRGEDARDILEELGGIDKYFDSTGVGYAYVSLADFDSAFEWLEIGYEERNWGMTRLRTMPYWRIYLEEPAWIRFRNDARYRGLVERMGFPALPPDHAGYADEQAWLARKAAADKPIEKIAVLPFANFSGDEEQDYFVDGMTDALISELAKIKSIKVISRTSVMRYKGTEKSIREIARVLGVDALVEGSVYKGGNEVRITAQLINGYTDEHMWSESYTNSLENILKLQGDMALTIAQEVKAALTPEEVNRFETAKAVVPDAYTAYLKGKFWAAKRTADDLEASIGYFEEAKTLDLDFALAYAGLADSYNLLASWNYREPVRTFEAARQEAKGALAIDESLGEAHNSLAWVNFYAGIRTAGAWADADRQFRRAIELNPSYATAHQWYAEFLASMGRLDQAVVESNRALELDPLSLIINGSKGYVLYLARRYDESVVQLEETLQMDENYAPTLNWLADVYWETGKTEEGLELTKRRVEPFGNTLRGRITLGLAYVLSGDEERGKGILAALPDGSTEETTHLDLLARLYANLNEKDRAFEILHDMLDQHAWGMAWLKVDPKYDPLRDDPRFDALLARMHFPK